MIQMGTILEVADNSGAKRISCIQLRGGSTGRYRSCNRGDYAVLTTAPCCRAGTGEKHEVAAVEHRTTAEPADAG